MIEFEVVENITFPERGPSGRWHPILDAVANGSVVKLPKELTTNANRNGIVSQAQRRGMKITVRTIDGCLHIGLVGETK